MSNFHKTIKDPRSGKYERAEFLDMGQSGYRVRFPDGKLYKDDGYKWQEAPAGVILMTIAEWESKKGIKLSDRAGFDQADVHIEKRVWSEKGFDERAGKCKKEVRQDTTGSTVAPLQVVTHETPETTANSDKTQETVHPSTLKPWLFKPGQSGNPKGPKPGYKIFKYAFKDALEKMTLKIKDPSTGEVRIVTGLEAVVLAQVTKAASGDTPAATFIADRVDGKPKETMEVNAVVEWTPDPKRKQELMEFVGLIKTKQK